MNGGSMDFLLWVRGTGFNIAMVVLIVGVLVRLIEILALGRKADLAPRRSDGKGSGWRTIFTRSIPPPGMLKASPVTYIAGYIFHLGLFIVVFLFVPHILLIKDLLGISWPGLPSALVDAVTVITLITMVAVLANRLTDPVKRFLSGFEDYLVWALTALPLLTGYLAFNHLTPDYTFMLALHILSVQLLLVALPFTKLMHAITFVLARWYTGDIFGRKGVAS
ncbi:MAG: hypothetical protein DWQ09_01950 [Proteobacteria bacterium]|nr:MAG: hypothetical protein DWQ09_01950 [Pseudomonadota bacterium]QKK10335.1 MAG: hypothetical protein HND59_00625 [Pseudomonadota bacterium]